MALKDIWKLQDYIPESIKQIFQARVDAANTIANPLYLAKIIEAINFYIPKDKELSGAEALARNATLAEALSKGLMTSNLPPWLVTILTIITQSQISVHSITTSNELILEKNVLQALRKQIRPALLGTSEAVEARQRNLINDTKLKDQLGRAGIPDADIALLVELAKTTPSSGEIADYASRGGYDDASAATFQKDSGLSEALSASKKDRDAAGVADEHFKKMWRSHWQSPGTDLVFEMLRRKAIDPSIIDAYFNEKNISPFWSKAFKDISTSLLNKLDVRKLHKAGIITDAELKPLFAKMGYGPEDADKLARGTIFANQHPEAAEQTPQDAVKAKQKDLSSEMILNALSEGLIDGNKAKNLLGSLGYSPEEIALLSAQEQHDTEKSYINALTSTYRQLYVKGLIDGDTTQKQLAAIPLTPGAVKKLIDLWNLERLAAIDPPSRADVLRWHKKKFIDDALTTSLLLQIGTSDEFIPFYIKENT